MTSIPLAVTCLREPLFTLPSEAQILLDSGKVLAYGLTCWVPEGRTDSDWLGNMDVCVPGADGVPTWETNWPELRAYGITGLGDALASLQMPALFSPQTMRSLLYASSPMPQDSLVSIYIAKDATWTGVSDPFFTFEDAYGYLEAVCAKGEKELADFVSSPLFPIGHIANLLLVKEADSAHRNLDLAVQAQKAAATVAQLMPFLFETSSGTCFAPAPPRPEVLANAILNPK